MRCNLYLLLIKGHKSYVSFIKLKTLRKNESNGKKKVYLNFDTVSFNLNRTWSNSKP